MLASSRVAGAALLAILVSGASGKRPHIVFVLADDYGWGNLGWHRKEDDNEDDKQARAEVQTPTLDSLIEDGILINRHYAYKICSPSRSSLQSGRLAVHVNTENTGVTVMNTSDPVSGYAGIPRNMTGIAQKLRDSGYRTHMVGKWDAGMATPEHTPLGRGYESWVGYFQHANDYWRKDIPIAATGEVDNCLNSFNDIFMINATYRGGVRDGVTVSKECTEKPEDHEYCYEEYLFKQRALQVINEHDTTKADAPLFLFYAFHLLHTPLQVPESYLLKIDEIIADAGGKPIDARNRRLYAAMVMYMDDAVREFVDALKAKNMWKDTLFVFAADNGGPVYEPGAANNHPLKGGKYNDYEGGVRTNAFVSGGFVPEVRRGSSFEGVVSIADWYGTFCELAHTDMADHAAAAANGWLHAQGLPLLQPVDSVPQWGFILNDTNGRAEALHISTQSVLVWPYKLITGKQVYNAWQGPLFPNCTTIAGLRANFTPSFQDIKVFNTNIPVAKDPQQQRAMTWTGDCDSGCLFNVEADPTEHEDLAAKPEYAWKLLELQAELFRLNGNHFQPGRGTPSLEACNRAIDIGGFYGPFIDAENWYTPLPPVSMTQNLKNKARKSLLQVVNSQPVSKRLEHFGHEHGMDILMRIIPKTEKCLSNTTQTSTTYVHLSYI